MRTFRPVGLVLVAIVFAILIFAGAKKALSEDSPKQRTTCVATADIDARIILMQKQIDDLTAMVNATQKTGNDASMKIDTVLTLLYDFASVVQEIEMIRCGEALERAEKNDVLAVRYLRTGVTERVTAGESIARGDRVSVFKSKYLTRTLIAKRASELCDEVSQP